VDIGRFSKSYIKKDILAKEKEIAGKEF